MIELMDVSKHFGQKVAVDGLNLRVNPGELYAFVGPNGAGKTTTIKMIVGLLRPTRGRIRISGFYLPEESIEAKRNLSYVPDLPYLYEKLTGREFLQFVGRMYGLPDALTQERIERYGELFGYLDYMDQLCQECSHGMKQRIILASAFIHDARVIVIDEPMVGLDPKGARILKDHLRQKVKEGACAFVSTHTLAVAEEVATRIGIIHQGRLIAEGNLEDLRALSKTGGTLEEMFLELTSEESAGA